jgi:hypothetical protein
MNRHAFAEEFGADPLDRFPALGIARDRRLLDVEADVIRLTRPGRLLASEVLEPLLPPVAA